MVRKVFIYSLLGFLLTSCASKKGILYFQNIEGISGEDPSFTTTLQPDDLLTIIVSAAQPEAAIPFNLSTVSVVNTVNSGNTQNRFQEYLIDNKGNIEFPVVGTIKLGGLTKTEAVEKLTTEIEKYIKDPIVNMRIVNYKISVMGEVARPGVFSTSSERITLPQAISQAGDMTIYGKRDRVLVIREADGQRTYNYVDMTQADFINSPYFYLHQNDIVYVEPNRTRVNSSVIGPNLTVGISAISLLITIISIATR